MSNKKILAAALVALAAAAFVPDQAWAFWVPDVLKDGYKTTDPAIQWLNAIFGDGAFSDAGANSTVAGMGEIFKWFNTMIFSLAAIFVTYNLVAGVMNSAHEGEIFGREVNSMWAPLRVATAIALMAPMSNGYTSIQIVTGHVAVWGVAAANIMWSKTVEVIARNGGGLVAPMPPQAVEITRDALAALTCMHAENEIQGVANKVVQGKSVSYWQESTIINGNPVMIIRFGRHATDEICGKFVLSGAISSFDTFSSGEMITRMEDGAIAWTDMAGFIPAAGVAGLTARSQKLIQRSNQLAEEARNLAQRAGNSADVATEKMIRKLYEQSDQLKDVARQYTLRQSSAGTPAGNAIHASANAGAISATSQLGDILSRQEDAASSAQAEIVATIGQAHAYAFFKLIQPDGDLYKVARGIVEASKSDPQTRKPPPSFEPVARAMSDYNKTIYESVAEVLAAQRAGNASIQGQIAAINSLGWAGAGSFYMSIAAMNAEVMTAVDNRPAFVTQETFDFSSTPPSGMEKRGAPPAGTLPYMGAAYRLWWNQYARGFTMANDNPQAAASLAGEASGGSSSGGESEESIGFVSRITSAVTDTLNVEKQAQEAFDRVTGAERFNNWLYQFFNPGNARGTTAADGSTSTSEFGAILPRISALGHNILTTIGIILSLLAITSAIPLAGTGLVMIGLSLILPMVMFGALLAYVVPMMPFIMWTLSVLAWLVLVVEAIVAGPLWGFAHLRMGGSGFAGEAGPSGYLITLNVFMRPMLMLFGLLIGLSVFILIGNFFATGYNVAFNDAQMGGEIGPIGLLMQIGIMSAMFVVIAERCFALISVLPDRIMRWIGSNGEGLGEEQQTNTVRGAAVAVISSGQSTSQAVLGKAIGSEKMPLGGPGVGSLGIGPGPNMNGGRTSGRAEDHLPTGGAPGGMPPAMGMQGAGAGLTGGGSQDGRPVDRAIDPAGGAGRVANRVDVATGGTNIGSPPAAAGAGAAGAPTGQAGGGRSSSFEDHLGGTSR